MIAAQTPCGWSTLVSLVPSVYIRPRADCFLRHSIWHRFWLGLAAPLLVLSISQLSALRAILETRFLQYLGRISFALYLVHMPIAMMVGDVVYRLTGFVWTGPPESKWDGWCRSADGDPWGWRRIFGFAVRFGAVYALGGGVCEEGVG